MMRTGLIRRNVTAASRLSGIARQGLGLMVLSAFSLLPMAGYGQALDPEADVAQQNLRIIVEDWADLQKSFKESDSLDSLIEHFERRLNDRGETVTRLPDSNPHKAEMLAVLNKIKAEFPVQAKAAQGALETKHLTENWERDSADGAGWEQESATTFATMLKQQSEATSRLGLPKTVTMYEEANDFLTSTKPKTDDAAVKALIDSITKTRDATRAKLLKAATAIADEAAKTKLTQDSRDRLETFGQDDLRISLDEAPEAAPLQAKVASLVAAYDKAAGGSKAEVDKLSSDLNQQAATAWPTLAGKVDTTEDFDAGAALKNPGKYKGKRYLLSGVSNRMGWDFKTGSYDFAMHSNGTAVVGRYDAAVKSAVEDTKKRLQLNDLPEEDYDLIVEVADTAKATVFQDVEGDVKIEGTSEKLKVTGRREVSEEAVLLHIIGLHVGPVAVVAGAGAVEADGSIKDVAGPSGAGVAAAGGAFLHRLVWFLISVAVGLLVLVKAGFRSLAGVAPLQKVSQSLGASGTTKLGLVFLVLGVWFLLRGFLVYGLLVSVSFILAGLYLSLDFLVARKWLPEKVASQIRPQGVNIGIGVIVIAVLHLLLGGRFLVL